MIPFTHLHVHSCYSQLDGMSSIEGLVNKTISLGMKAIALTDHGNMFGIKAFYDYVLKKNKKLLKEDKIKPILGIEAYMAHRGRLIKTHKEDLGGWHLIILAKNKQGYKNLCKLVSTSWIEGFYNRPRIDRECLIQYKEGLIITSACLGGEISQKILLGKLREAEEAIFWFKTHFREDFYLEIQRHLSFQKNSNHNVYTKQLIVNRGLLELAKKTETEVVCTNDVHFIEKEHAEAHDRLICIGLGKELSDQNRLHYTKQEWFKSSEEMNNIFFDLPETLYNTTKVANKIENYSLYENISMPVYSIPKEFATEYSYRKTYTEQNLKKEFNKEDLLRFKKLGGYNKVLRIKLEADYLKQITFKEAKTRYGDGFSNEVEERLKFELEIIKTMGFPGYFLIVQDIIKEARRMGVSVGPGRGSASGSVVAYCLGITDIDPLKYNLLFERFLNPDRISMPDIDIDFDDDGRLDVIRWVKEKYGKDKVANIVTYTTMATKSSIKDVGRVQGLPFSETDRLTKLIPDRLSEVEMGRFLKVNITNCIKHLPELKAYRYSDNKNLSDTLKYAEMLEGTVRQIGVHPCGIIIGADDLTNLVPLAVIKEKGTNENVLITQYEGSVIESVGLIKMDFLGLKTLSIIKETIANIKKSKDQEIDINHISHNDSKTYELYSEGKTIGIFQFESLGMRKYLRELKPTKFEDLIAMNALYRPGPMAYIPDFIARKHGEKEIYYNFPEMKNILQETYGITVYQEQVMLLSRVLAGFTRGQSDELRKAMGKKLKDKMEKLHDKFIEGSVKNNFGPKEELEKIWSDWVKFSEYAFNKSHATCYSLISYQTAYLKAHYPVEFLAANLTHNWDNIGEITKFMNECRIMNVKVLGPNINDSELTFRANKEGNIRFGLGGVKGLGRSTAKCIIEERNKNGIFKTIFDFIERIDLSICTKKSIEALSFSGSFDSFKELKREHLVSKNTQIGESFLETIFRYGTRFQSSKKSSLKSLFDDTNPIETVRPKLPIVKEWSTIERLNKEKELIGVYLSSNPLDKYYLELHYICNLTLKAFNQVKKNQCGKEFIFAGIVIDYKEGKTKNHQLYGVLTLEDYESSSKVFLFGNNYFQYKQYASIGMLLLIKGQFVFYSLRNKSTIRFKIFSIKFLSEDLEKIVKKITIFLSLSQLAEFIINSLFSMMEKMQEGEVSLCFYIENQDLKNQILFLKNIKKRKYQIDKAFLNFLKFNQITFKIN